MLVITARVGSIIFVNEADMITALGKVKITFAHIINVSVCVEIKY